MWGAFLLDAYRWDERREVADALEGIASARDRYGFASGAVYCFWEWGTRKVLYIGRAVDLPQRFRQHNGFAERARGCKLERLERYFEDHERVGYGVLVRSPNLQTSTGRFKAQLKADFGAIEHMLEDRRIADDTELEIAHAEGIALRSMVLATGGLPPWNAVGGTLSEWGAALNRPDHTAEFLTGGINVLLQARCTIRELDDDPTATQFESVLLAARSAAACLAIAANVQLSDYDILIALDRLADNPDLPPWVGLSADRDRIRESGYVLRKPWVMDADPLPGDLATREAWSAGEPMPAPPRSPVLREA